MGSRLRVPMMVSMVLLSTPALALPLITDDERISGELSSLNEIYVVTIVAWPAPSTTPQAATPWVSVADTGSWPACWFALALMLHELWRVRTLGRRAGRGASGSGE